MNWIPIDNQEHALPLPTGWVDVWPALRQDSVGWTFDSARCYQKGRKYGSGVSAWQLGGAQSCLRNDWQAGFWGAACTATCSCRHNMPACLPACLLSLPPGVPQARLDRVLGRLRDWEPLAVEMVGQEPIPGLTRIVRTGKTARSDKTIPVWPRWVRQADSAGVPCVHGELQSAPCCWGLIVVCP